MVMTCAQQGDILWLEQEEQYVLVLSRAFFNQSGMSVVCPLRDKAKPDALHIGISSDEYNGTAYIYRSGLGRKTVFVPGMNDFLGAHPHE